MELPYLIRYIYFKKSIATSYSHKIKFQDTEFAIQKKKQIGLYKI